MTMAISHRNKTSFVNFKGLNFTHFNNYLDIKPIRTRHRDAPILKSFKSNCKVVDRSVYLQTATAWNNMDADTRSIENQRTI